MSFTPFACSTVSASQVAALQWQSEVLSVYGAPKHGPFGYAPGLRSPRLNLAARYGRWTCGGEMGAQKPAALRIEEGSDESLIEKIAAGDRTAMKVLYTRHSTRVYRFLQRIVRNETRAEDLLSDVFLDVWQQAARFEKRSAVSTWILSIARFKALSSFRAKQHDALEPETSEMIEDEADNPEVIMQKFSKANALRACLESLSAAHRQVIDLVYYHERTVEEVGVILGIPTNTVKTRMFHARKQLSELLKQAGIDRGWP